MYKDGHTVTHGAKLPLNLLDALREFDADERAEIGARRGVLGRLPEAEASGVERLRLPFHAVGASTTRWTSEAARFRAADPKWTHSMRYSISLARARRLVQAPQLAARLARPVSRSERYEVVIDRRRRPWPRHRLPSGSRSSESATSPCWRRAGSARAMPAATPPSSAPTTCCPATSASTSLR